MHTQNVVWWVSEPGHYARGRQTRNVFPSHFSGNQAQILIVLAVSIFIVGCDSGQPRYEVYPTLSIQERLEHPEKDNPDPNHQWKKQFDSAMDTVARHEWNPSTRLLQDTFHRAADDYGISLNERDPNWFNWAEDAFTKEFKLDGNDPCKNSIKCGVGRMCDLIDIENRNILVMASRIKSPPLIDFFSTLPSLVSGDYPVGVAVTKWKTPPCAASKPDESTTIITAGSVIKSSKPPLIFAPDCNFFTCRATKDDTKDKDGKEESTDSSEDYSPEQSVTLSVSTVLNSPLTLDRIEHVSTYLYLQPFPSPPNGDVVLEREFWKRFFSLNNGRDLLIRSDTAPQDMCRAIEDMRVRIIEADTAVELRDVNLGKLTRSTSDQFSAGVSANIAAIEPTMSYSSGVTTEMVMQLQQQLDQRSTYIDPPGKFLRLVQRGMQTVNLAGRIVRNIKLYIPASQELIPVLVPVKSGDANAVKCRVRWFSQPLYSRVDAFTLSIVVARQATALAKSTKDSFRLDDPKDAAFIVGVTRPYRMTLWQNERGMTEVTTTDIFGHKVKNETVYFRTFDDERIAPLTLSGFTPEQEHELCRRIRDIIKVGPNQWLKDGNLNKDGTVSFVIDPCDPNKITVGLRDVRDANELVGFKQKI